jgi:hypothetical protein
MTGATSEKSGNVSVTLYEALTPTTDPLCPSDQGRVMLGLDSPMAARRPELRLPLGTPLGGP